MMRVTIVSLFLGLILVSISRGQPDASDASVVYEVSDNSWFEGDVSGLEISADAQWALFRRLNAVHLVSLQTGQEDRRPLAAGLDNPEDATFCGTAAFALRERRGTQQGWFVPAGNSLRRISVPDDARLACSADGTRIAFFRGSKPADGVFIGSSDSFKNYPFDGDVTGLAFTPDGTGIYSVLLNKDGVSSLVRLTIADNQVTTVARDLDMMQGRNSIGVSRDGSQVFLALASSGPPDNKARHQPNASRWLGIYGIDVNTGARHPIIVSEEDNYDPALAGSSLYWTRLLRHKSIAVLPANGGDVRELLPGAELPIWSPEGRRISYVFNRDRLTDGPLPMDAGVIGVDSEARAISKPSVIVSGYHEDFSAAFSPNGRWIAFHSHRSQTPVPFSQSPGSTDDIYLRRANDMSAPEIRLTDFGWEAGPAFWSPDGRKLMFSSWVKGGEPDIDKIWILSIDPETGIVEKKYQFPTPSAVRSAEWTAWSPDGQQIAIEDNQGDEKRSIWIVRVDGSEPRKLVDYKATTYGGLDWMPDGKNIIYSGLSGSRMQIFSISTGGGFPKLLTHDSETLIHPRVSPDGRWIACSRMTKSDQILRRPM